MSTDDASASDSPWITEQDPLLLQEIRSGRELLRVQQAVASAVAEFPPPADFFPRVLTAIADNLGFGFGAVWRPDARTEPAALEPA